MDYGMIFWILALTFGTAATILPPVLFSDNEDKTYCQGGLWFIAVMNAIIAAANALHDNPH